MRDVALELPAAGWDDVGGLDGVKARLLEALGGAEGGGGGGQGGAATATTASPPSTTSRTLPPSAADMARVGATPPGGVLLFGPPGTGKTALARAAACAAGRNFFAVKGPELLSAYVGDSEKAVASLFARARAAAPAVVFFDELDGLAPARPPDGAPDAGAAACDRVVSQLLTELDGGRAAGGGVLVLAATNRPDALDTALLRPGRFDRCLYVGPPASDADRVAVLRAATRHTPLAPDVDLGSVAARTPGFTGADLAALARAACLAAVEEGGDGADAVTAAHWEAALAGAAPSPAPSPAEAEVFRRYERAGHA